MSDLPFIEPALPFVYHLGLGDRVPPKRNGIRLPEESHRACTGNSVVVISQQISFDRKRSLFATAVMAQQLRSLPQTIGGHGRFVKAAIAAQTKLVEMIGITAARVLNELAPSASRTWRLRRRCGRRAADRSQPRHPRADGCRL
jgi:hypothetical protein